MGGLPFCGELCFGGDKPESLAPFSGRRPSVRPSARSSLPGVVALRLRHAQRRVLRPQQPPVGPQICRAAPPPNQKQPQENNDCRLGFVK